MKEFEESNSRAVFEIYKLLPEYIANEIKNELICSGQSEDGLFEIRLRLGGKSSILTRLGTRTLKSQLGEYDMNVILSKLTGGALYAHRDTIIDGYISALCGVRVGVCGRMRYDGSAPIGVSEIRSFVIRVPHKRCDFGEQLYDIWRSRPDRGMLIYSPPGVGKTTAIRFLAGKIGISGRRVCVVDERCEFNQEDYTDSEVDILRGYKKSKGIEIAIRTLAPQVVIVDEIGAQEAASLLSTLTLGVPFIATVHAKDSHEILERGAFAPFIEAGAFETLVGIKRCGNSWRVVSSDFGNGRGRVKLSKENSAP